MNNYQLSQLVINGFKSIRECDLKLNAMNVLIGPNGVGKSNFIGFFKLIQQMLDQNLQTYVSKQGGPDAILHFGRKTTEQLSAALYFGNNGYKFTLEPTQLSYDAAIAQEKNGRPFGVDTLREIQLSKRDVLETLASARKQFSTSDWKLFLLRSIGIDGETLSERAKDAYLLRMVPFVERNYNLVELGPRGTGKSHLFQQVSPYAHLISGGKATAVAEIAVEKGASALLMPVACRRQLFDLSDDMATKIDIQFYSDARDALLKAIQE
jgi:energy-coupling factor transporter ATP-binding protein EcfA2